MTEAYPSLVEALNALRRQWRQQKLLEGMLLTLAGATAVLLVVVAVDNWVQPERVWRLCLSILLWGALVGGILALVVRRWLEDRRDDFFASLVEQKHPELNNQLINALQLGRGHPYGSPELIDAIVKDAANATADLEMTECLDARLVKRAGLIALAALIVISGYAAAVGPRFPNGLARVLLPGADIPAYSLFQIEEASIKPGNKRAPEGDAVAIEAKVASAVKTAGLPATAQLLRRSGEHPWRLESMARDTQAEGIYRCTVPQVAESFDYYVAAGDGRSRVHRIEVVKRPKVEKVSLTYTLPEYTSQTPRQVADSDGEISGIAGTTVAVELKTTKPLREASFVTENGEILSLQHAEDERTWRGSFVIWSKDAKLVPEITGQMIQAPTRYQIKLVDTEPERCANADPLWRPISLAKDQPPSIVLVQPGRDLQIKPDGVVTLQLDAKDDYGVGEVRLLYRINDERTLRELARFAHAGPPALQTSDQFAWPLARTGLKAGDLVQYWATVADRNNITGPGQAESRRFSLFVLTPESVAAKLEMQIADFAQVLEELLRLQRENRAQTASDVAFDTLVSRQSSIRNKTNLLARAMQRDAFPIATMIKALDELYAGLMAEAVRLLEHGRDAGDVTQAASSRNQALPLQDKIIAQLQDLLARLQRNEQAREALRKLAKKDQPAHQAITKTLSKIITDLNKMLSDKTELAGKFEKMPKKTDDKLSEESLKALKDFEQFQDKLGKWAKGTVEELTKLPTGFVDDFGLRADANKIFEEIEKAANRQKAEKIEVSLEDLGAGLATKMKEDLEVWMPDSPDSAKWVLEEPLDKKPMKIPEMPLPKALEDMIGDLLQKAEEFDEEADDVTSAWGDNLDQAGWGVSDGPISTFSAKGKTGNDLPNNMELQGRSGDGRRGKSSGQMVGDTARALGGRKTPARVGAEKYEPGQLKQEGQQDPNGATGGGKKAGAGRHGLQGGTPPDFVRDIGRLSEKQIGLREKAEQVAQRLETLGIASRRLNESIHLMKTAEQDLRDLRYQDAARRRRTALGQLKSGLLGVDQTTAVQLNRARDLPAQLRQELLQANEEAFPDGFEALLKSYFRALSSAEK
jgi:hypothetical protein